MRTTKPLLATLTLASMLALSACGGSSDNAGNESSSNNGSASQTSSETASTSTTPTSSPTPEMKKELFGGGEHIFPDRRFVALYGSPGTPSLGVLGEYDPAGAVKEAKRLAAEYQPYSKEPVQPAFETITTVASSAPGADGDYSDEMDIKKLLPLIEEAEKNDVYVILDFQPGRSDFPSQVKKYEELLKRPNVGLGIDPEWRLEPHQVHLEQIGSVTAAEVNQTLDYLAELTKKNDLPQKLVVLHQFTLSMIQDRETIKTDRPELALTLHADGHGTPELKKDTYRALLEDLDPKIYPSWKNFYDEDTPTMTPKQTYELENKPWVVTYQ